MKENRIGTFNLKPDMTPFEARRWLSLTLHSRKSILVGNPNEGEYLAFSLLSHDSGGARFVISEKKGGSVENDIKYEYLELNKSYVLQGTSIAVRCYQDLNPEFTNISMAFSAPKNVDIIRAEILEGKSSLKKSFKAMPA